MELPRAYHAALLATLCCAILPLVSFVVYVCLQRRWGKTANEKVMTYRVRGIPLDWNEARLGNFLEKNGVDLEVKSLALNIRGDKKMASGTVKRAPSTPPTIPGLSLDDGFHGITTFYAPSPEDHKIE